MDLLTLVVAILAFGLVAWAIQTWAAEPFRRWGLIALLIFAVIFGCEQLGIFAMLSRIRI